MDRLRLRRRLRMILVVGSTLAALAYLGSTAIRVRVTWAAYHAESELEEGNADAEALNSSLAGGEAEKASRKGRIAEAEQWTRFIESSRQRESLHRRKSREWLRRWW
jgi:cell division protein FtsB